MFLISCQVPPFFCLGGKYTSNNNNTKKKKKKQERGFSYTLCDLSIIRTFFSISNRDSLDIKEEKDHSTLPCKYTYKKNKFYFSSSD
jgi:hypothetical protein